MSITTSAYKREIDGRNGWTNPIEVSVHRAYEGEEIRLHVGDYPGATAHLDLAHARELREALDEAIMLAELAEGCQVTVETPARGMTLEAGPERTRPRLHATQDGATGESSTRNAVPRAAGAAPTRGAQPPARRTSMDAAETLIRLDEIGAPNLTSLLQRAVQEGICTIPSTPFTLVCNDANPADPRFSVVNRSKAERLEP